LEASSVIIVEERAVKVQITETITPEFSVEAISEAISSLIDVSTKFENISTKQIMLDNEKTYIYNLIEAERIEVLVHKENPSMLFYFIRINDKNAMFISELNKSAYATETNLCHYFYKIYPKLEPVKEETKKKNEDKKRRRGRVAKHEHLWTKEDLVIHN